MRLFGHTDCRSVSVRGGHRLLLAGSLVVAACSGEPTAPPITTGIIAATITGLPAGYQAPITISGPGGYDRSLTASATLQALVPGSYVVSAPDAQDGVHQYQANSPSQSITVTASATPVDVIIEY